MLAEPTPYRRLTVFVQPGDPAAGRLPALKGLQVSYGDITRRDEVQRAVRGHSHVFHLAGLLSYQPRERDRLVSVNHHGVENLVEACLQHGVRRRRTCGTCAGSRSRRSPWATPERGTWW